MNYLDARSMRLVHQARLFAETRSRLMLADDVETLRSTVLMLCDELEQVIGENYGCEIEAARRSVEG